MEKIYDCAVVGGGIAGYEAALALTNFKREILWMGMRPFGEKIPRAEKMKNFPAFSGSGRELESLLQKQMEEEKVPFRRGRIDGIFAADGKFLLTENQAVYEAKTVILATGVESGGTLRGEENFLGRGVSYCAVCDGALYKNKRVAAVLSSAEFEQETEFLAQFAQKVDVFCKYENPSLKGENLQIHTGIPVAVEGKDCAERLILKDGSLEVDGVFLLKNSAPPSALVGGLKTGKDGHVEVGRDLSTNLPGLFAAGDVTGRPYQVVKAAGEGLVAAFSANEYLGRTKQ